MVSARGTGFVSEETFSKQVLAYFARHLSGSRFTGRVVVREKVKVVKDFTIGSINGTWSVVAGVQQQDIVFYCTADAIPYRDFKSKAMLVFPVTQ